MINLQPRAEEQTHKGRIDMGVETPDRVFIFEFKLDKSARTAMAQIHKNQYAQKFVYLKKPITLVGVAVNSKERMVSKWVTEEFSPIA